MAMCKIVTSLTPDKQLNISICMECLTCRS